MRTLNTTGDRDDDRPVEGGDCSSAAEWGRSEDVRRLFGLKRGTLYNLWHEGLISGNVWSPQAEYATVRVPAEHFPLHPLLETVSTE